MGHEIEKIELTEAQARELKRMVKRARSMYDDRHGGEAMVDKLWPMRDGLEEVQDGEKDALYLSFGMKGGVRKEIISVIEMEITMEEKKMAQDWGMDGRKMNALKNGLEALKNPEIVDSDDLD